MSRFVWGAATAAFQIEGATRVDGRGESIWDRFAATPGKVHAGHTGEPACEHYFRWRDDLDLMADLGLQSYRFSIAWPRVQPDGRGRPNPKGLDFYRRLVDGLLDRGIAPLATLYHWDLPQALEDEGGWTGRGIVDRFAEYAALVYDALGDVVPDWITHNEPWVSSFLGYGVGVKAPGIADRRAALRAAHHLLLSHGAAVRAYRESGHEGRIGITLDLTVARPAHPGAEDAARRLDGEHNRWFLDPIFRGRYPDDVFPDWRADADDLALIAQPIDFLGINFYRPTYVDADGRDVQPEAERTAMGWAIVPEALTELLVRVKRDYGDVPLLITENGAAFDDELDGGDVVDDPQRVAYLRDHVDAVELAVAQGVNVRGFYVWSLLDNFEWEHGYDKRFGIVFVDYPTQRRIPKRSALWYRDLIRRSNGTD